MKCILIFTQGNFHILLEFNCGERDIFSSSARIFICLLEYDRIDRNGLWQVLRIFGFGGNSLWAFQSLYNEIRACVRGESGVSEWFDVNVGLR